MGLFTRTCPFCRRRFDPPAMHAPCCSYSCFSQWEDQRKARDRAIRSSASSFSGGGGGGYVTVDDPKLTTARAQLKATLAPLRRLEAEQAAMQQKLRAAHANARRDPEIQALQKQIQAARATAARDQKRAEHAEALRNQAQGQANSQLFDTLRFHEEQAEVLEGIRTWLLALAGVEQSEAYTIQFDELQVPKALRSDLAQLISQYTRDHHHTYVRLFKQWSSKKPPQRIEAELSKQAAEQLKRELSLLGNDLRLTVVPVGAEAELSLGELCGLVEARAHGQSHAVDERAPEHPGFDELVEMTVRFPQGRIRGGRSLRADTGVVRLAEILEVPDDERLLLAGCDSGLSWTVGWILTNRALRSRDRTGTHTRTLAELQGVTVRRQHPYVLVGDLRLLLLDHHKRATRVFEFLARDWGL